MSQAVMSQAALTCRDEKRRHAVREARLNGLDFLELGADRRTLEVFFLGRAPAELRQEHFIIEGGRRVRGLRITDLLVHRREEPETDDSAVLTVDREGDFSTYTLRVVALDAAGRPTGAPMPGFDPRYDRLQFSFKADCPSELDCKTEPICPVPAPATPELSYLAKDYQSFRRLALDRLAALVPEWRERHVPDLGIALVELLAYTADHLSYHQDAVATEAYLATARQRVSVRRHARLVDYEMHEGTNARAWVTLDVRADLDLALADFYLITGYDGAPARGKVLRHDDLPVELPRPWEVFEPLEERTVRLYAAHTTISFYTWGDRQCCLPRGTTRAMLRDPAPPPAIDEPGKNQHEKNQQEQGAPVVPPPPEHQLQLEPGDVLIFEEVLGPRSGKKADADPAHRHAVRLTRVVPEVDPLDGQPIVEIEWHPEDALPFALCVSSLGPECELLEDVSVARGNAVLVDHGRRVADEDLEEVPPGERRFECVAEGRAVELPAVPLRYRPRLAEAPLAFAAPYDPADSATAAVEQDPRRALPAVELAAGELAADGTFTPAATWSPRRDLLASAAEERHFVAEIDNRGHARLRFGDGELGARPPAAASLRATYRVGGGPRGNVGAGAIAHLVTRREARDDEITPRNPLPARGGMAPEPIADVKRLAGHAFSSELARAVTAEDYARLAAEHPEVERAVARLRWSGCSYKVLVAIDPRGRVETPVELLREVAARLHPYRRMGHEVLVGRALYVPLDVRLVVCVDPGHLRGHVRAALLERLSDRLLADGSRGFFHPDESSFGEGIELSRLVAAVQAVEGVESVPLDPASTRFKRWGEAADGEVEAGFLALGPFEIARLDNDPSFPENGVLELDLRGGR